jgi:hypothetical protein
MHLEAEGGGYPGFFLLRNERCPQGLTGEFVLLERLVRPRNEVLKLSDNVVFLRQPRWGSTLWGG